jgi:hypothetical protein
MSANIHGKMVYSFEKPMWHNITSPSTEEMSAEDIIIKRFGGAFPVFLRAVYVELNGKRQETGDLAIVRGVSPADPQEVVFGYCTERYHPLQPIEVARSFDQHVRQPAETMAFLGKGEEMFISWVLPEFEVVKEDVIQMYGIIRGGFDTLKAYRLFTANVRPVCWNTITMAEGWAKRNTDRAANKGMIWKGKGVNKNLLRDLGYWLEHVQGKALQEAELLKSFFGKLAATPIKNDDEAWRILFRAYPDTEFNPEYYPAPLRAAKVEKVEAYNTTQKELREGIHGLFAGAGTAITPDYWGMLNATSEFFCHVQPSKRPIAESVMFGPRQKNIMAMVETLSGKA